MLTSENPIEYDVFLSQYLHEGLHAMWEAMKGLNSPVPLKPTERLRQFSVMESMTDRKKINDKGCCSVL